MKKLMIAVLLCLSCATVATEERTYNRDGSPRPLPSEMELGRAYCRDLCGRADRKFQDYLPDGRCLCQPAEQAKLDPNNQT